MSLGWQSRMEAALDWIEDHLSAEMDWGALAALANCSSFHFMRMFEVITGQTVAEYVRRRRLSQAALELAATAGAPATEASVTDLSLRYGYESPDAFAKAFRRLFGCSPSEARQPGRSLHTWPRLEFAVILKGSNPMQFRIEQKPAFSLIGPAMRVTCVGGENFRVIPQMWQRVMTDGTFQTLLAAMPPNSQIGVAGVCAEQDQAKENFTYLIAIEQPAPGAALPAGSRALEVPAATWAMFEERGRLPDDMQSLWKRIFGEWFPTSGFEHAGGPELELYPDPPGPDGRQSYAVWIPVKRVS